MRRKISGKYLPFLTLGVGLVGFGLQLWQYCAGTDEKNFLVSGHPSGILLWILVALYLAAAAAIAYKSPKKCRYIRDFPVNSLSTAGCLIGAAGAFFIDIWFPCRQGTATFLSNITGISEFVSLLLLALLGGGKRNLQSGLYSLLSVAFMLRLISQYKQWSFLPQIGTYCFALLASVCLMLTAFHRATLAYNSEGYRRYIFFSQAAVFFCCLCLVSSTESYLFHIAMSAWILMTYTRGSEEAE